MWSEDGATWNPGFTHDMGALLDGLEQTVVVTGLSWFNTGGSYADWDYIKVTPATKTVSIDIKPWAYPNSINLKSNSVVPVAVLTTADFDASTVDPATVSFADADPVRWHFEDIDGDGDMDMVFHFNTQDLMLNSKSTEATLTGMTLDGMDIEGSDSVNIVPKSKK
jgi:hypothetical protein